MEDFLSAGVLSCFENGSQPMGGQGVIPGHPPGDNFSRGGLLLGGEWPTARSPYLIATYCPLASRLGCPFF